MAVSSEGNKGHAEWYTESYLEQRKTHWPTTGKHILAQYDDTSIVVYQAFCPAIASYAVENQRFGGEAFSFTRMSWIKTNFLWMMYRCGWASKLNQERVLAVRLKREGFEEILSKAYTPKTQADAGLTKGDIGVRLQWDPDHGPDGEKQERKAIQLGMKGEVLQKYATEWIVNIRDVTDFVHEQAEHVKENRLEELMVARERVYEVTNTKTATLIGLL